MYYNGYTVNEHGKQIMSHVSKDGINLKIKLTAKTKCGESTILETEDVYNTFDDMKLFVADRLQYELFSEMAEDGIIFRKGVNTIIDERDADVTYTYTLVK